MFMKQKDKQKNVKIEGERGEEKKWRKSKMRSDGVVSLILKGDFLKF